MFILKPYILVIYPFAVVSYRKNDGAPDFHKDHLKEGKATFFALDYYSSKV